MRLLMVMMLAIPLCGQNFEVASIRHNVSGDERDSGINILPGGRIGGTNLTLKTLIWQAYNTVDFRLTGGPGWLDKDRYDVAAKTANGEKHHIRAVSTLAAALAGRSVSAQGALGNARDNSLFAGGR